ncbi:MAG: hypothetical protein HC828_11505 [Blastochloris sp.]|nr:hypothetical protein [Blastochloris sp.]
MQRTAGHPLASRRPAAPTLPPTHDDYRAAGRQHPALPGAHRLPACRPDGCRRHCPRVLFEHLLRVALPGVTLTPAARVVVSLEEDQHLAVVPRTTQAHLLDAAFLQQWACGRLIVTWSSLGAKAPVIQVGALLAVGAIGPEPQHALRDVGWRHDRLATLLQRRAFASEHPTHVRVHRPAGDDLIAAFGDPRSLSGDSDNEPAPAVAAMTSEEA